MRRNFFTLPWIHYKQIHGSNYLDNAYILGRRERWTLLGATSWPPLYLPFKRMSFVSWTSPRQMRWITKWLKSYQSFKGKKWSLKISQKVSVIKTTLYICVYTHWQFAIPCNLILDHLVEVISRIQMLQFVNHYKIVIVFCICNILV